MVLLGSDFQTDARFPSAGNILRQELPGDTRICSLVKYVIAVLRGSASRAANA
jgi:hypothetical protein